MQRYSKQVKEFIATNVAGKTTKELTELVNEKLGTDFTEAKMKSYKSNNKLKSGTFRGKPPGYSDKYPKEIYDFIEENANGRSTQELTDLVNDKYRKKYTTGQIRAFKKNHKISSGIDCRFQKGNVPQNKGIKGIYHSGCEVGWFKKGNIPHNHKPVGSERIDSKDGYTLIKTAEPNKWELKHKVIYESKFGKLPEGYIVTFLDGDKSNIEIDNLEAITMAESLELTRSGLRFDDANFTRTGILITKIKRNNFEHKNEIKKKECNHYEERK